MVYEFINDNFDWLWKLLLFLILCFFLSSFRGCAEMRPYGKHHCSVVVLEDRDRKPVKVVISPEKIWVKSAAMYTYFPSGNGVEYVTLSTSNFTLYEFATASFAKNIINKLDVPVEDYRQ
jgi:hypothetical protein